MNDDLISIQLLVVSDSVADRELWLHGAGRATVPVDVIEAEGAMAAFSKLASSEADVVILHLNILPADRTELIKAARAKSQPPLVVLATDGGKAPLGGSDKDITVDGVIRRPRTVEDAKALVERCARVRVPSRALIVDDSSTTRKLVRKILSASRFALDLFEAEEGNAALRQIASGKFEVVFLDYNMPGLNGIETLAQIKRQNPNVEVIMMTSTQNDAIAARAREAGAAAFIKKPFFPSDIDAVLLQVGRPAA